MRTWSTSTRERTRDLSTIKHSQEIKRERKKKNTPLPPICATRLIWNSDRCVGIGQYVWWEDQRKSFTPQKNMESVLLGRAINRVAMRACAYRDPVFSPDLRDYPLPNVKIRLQLVFIMALPSDATRLETQSFYFYFIYILLLLSSHLFILCLSIPQTQIRVKFVTYYNSTGRKGKNEETRDFPPKLDFFLFFFLL